MEFKRGKRKVIADTTSKDIYNFYKTKLGDKVLPYSTFIKIWKSFIDIRMEMVVYENVEFNMPFRLGSLRVKIGRNVIKIDKNGDVKLSIDWGATKKMWEVQYKGLSPEEVKAVPNKEFVYYLNEHTEGRVLHWHWDKITCNFKNKTAYRIQVIRKWKKVLKNKIMKTKKIEYYE